MEKPFYTENSNSTFMYKDTYFTVDYLELHTKPWMVTAGCLILKRFGETLEEAKEKAMKAFDDYQLK